MICFEKLNEMWNPLKGLASQCYRIGPFAMQISSNHASLIDTLTRAFAHLAAENTSPDLTIRLWSGPKLPPLNWSLIQTNGYRGYANPPFYFHYFEMIGALSAIDTERNIAYYIIRDPDSFPWWAKGSPLQAIFHVWLREKGMQLTHSACIANGKSGILLAGKGGSGKSTTVLACLAEGFATLGEDYVLLAPKCAYSVYQTAKWELYTRTLFPFYEAHITNPSTADQEKALVYYMDLFPSQILSSSPLHAVVSLQIGSSPRLQTSDLRTSLQSLLLTTAMQLPHPHPRTSTLLHEQIKQLDHYHLVLGPDLKQNVSLLRSLLE
jgi:hypothetical protein